MVIAIARNQEEKCAEVRTELGELQRMSDNLQSSWNMREMKLETRFSELHLTHQTPSQPSSHREHHNLSDPTTSQLSTNGILDPYVHNCDEANGKPSQYGYP